MHWRTTQEPCFCCIKHTHTHQKKVISAVLKDFISIFPFWLIKKTTNTWKLQLWKLSVILFPHSFLWIPQPFIVGGTSMFTTVQSSGPGSIIFKVLTAFLYCFQCLCDVQLNESCLPFPWSQKRETFKGRACSVPARAELSRGLTSASSKVQ